HSLDSNRCSRRDSSVSLMISFARVKSSQTVEIVVTTGCHCRCRLSLLGLELTRRQHGWRVCRLRHAMETTYRYRRSAQKLRSGGSGTCEEMRVLTGYHR